MLQLVGAAPEVQAQEPVHETRMVAGRGRRAAALCDGGVAGMAGVLETPDKGMQAGNSSTFQLKKQCNKIIDQKLIRKNRIF